MSAGSASDDAVPLSFGQQGILLSKLRAAPGSANQYVRLPLDPLPASDVSVRRFLRLLVQRNDALRATLVRTRDGAGLAFRSPDAAADAVVVHRAVDESLLSTEFKRGGPLVAAAIDARDPGAVHLVIDHLVFDGWSHSLLLEEATRIWRFVALGEKLPPPGGSLQSYMHDQQAVGEQDEHHEYTRFWRRAFERDFTLDMPRRAQATWQHIVFPYPEAIGELLPTARRRYRTTDFGLVLAAFTTALLGQTSAQRSLLVYSPVADRDETSADTIGCLLNFVAIRINLGGTVAETIESTREGLIGALAHQRGPFFRLLPRSGSGALVTAQPYLLPAETLTHFPGTATAMPASASDGWVIENCSPRPLGDLWFSFAHTRDGYHGEFAFSRNYLDPQAGLEIVRTLLSVLTLGLVAA